MIPVVYSPANQAVVRTFEDLTEAEQLSTFWSDETVTAVRKQIKDHYIRDQNQKCCYCSCTYPTNNNAVWDGEHIISRKSAKRFMFEPRNLAASCKDCNIAKGEQEVRVNPERVSFPDQSSHYKIVHPHFDEYNQHIRWWGKVVHPVSSKGVKLVEMCNLMRFGLETIGADTLPVNPTVADNISKFMDPHLSSLDANIALAVLKVHVESMEKKN